MRNLVPTSEDWLTPLPVPDDGEFVTADAAVAGDGPQNQAEQGMLNRLWAIVRGRVSLRSLTVDLNGGAVVPANPGSIGALGNILSVLGNITAELGDVTAGRWLIGSLVRLTGAAQSGTSDPTPLVAEDELHRDKLVFARAVVTSASGGLRRGMNIESVSRLEAGKLEIVTRNVPAYAAAFADGADIDACVTLTTKHASTPGVQCASYVVTKVTVDGTARAKIYVELRKLDGSLPGAGEEPIFSVVMWA